MGGGWGGAFVLGVISLRRVVVYHFPKDYNDKDYQVVLIEWIQILGHFYNQQINLNVFLLSNCVNETSAKNTVRIKITAIYFMYIAKNTSNIDQKKYVCYKYNPAVILFSLFNTNVG